MQDDDGGGFVSRPWRHLLPTRLKPALCLLFSKHGIRQLKYSWGQADALPDTAAEGSRKKPRCSGASPAPRAQDGLPASMPAFEFSPPSTSNLSLTEPKGAKTGKQDAEGRTSSVFAFKGQPDSQPRSFDNMQGGAAAVYVLEPIKGSRLELYVKTYNRILLSGGRQRYVFVSFIRILEMRFSLRYRRTKTS